MDSAVIGKPYLWKAEKAIRWTAFDTIMILAMR